MGCYCYTENVDCSIPETLHCTVLLQQRYAVIINVSLSRFRFINTLLAWRTGVGQELFSIC